jgi:purine-binding chemotaxis protein CheW
MHAVQQRNKSDQPPPDKAPQGGALVRGTASAEERRQYLTFALNNEVFAIGILHVKEILEYADVAPVPLVPSFIRGVINLRGQVVPVIDLAARFSRTSAPVTKRSCVIIVEVGGRGEDGLQDIGVVVDAVHTILDIPVNDVEPPPAFGAKIRTDFIQGMGRVNGKFIILLNLAGVISVDEMAQIVSLSGTEEGG